MKADILVRIGTESASRMMVNYPGRRAVFQKPYRLLAGSVDD
ncbi:MAG: hypothetical protein PVJ39_03570 [Gammaproteobacteria bacterium]|jgi:hypothetical protein